jgi:hypothetical protein
VKEFEIPEWAAAFGACVAAQVAERMRLGQGPPDTDQDWDRIAEEAVAVADLAAEALGRLRQAKPNLSPLAAPRPDWRETEPTREQAEAHGGLWLVRRLGVDVAYFTGQGWNYADTCVSIEIRPGAQWCPCDRDFQALPWPETKE